MEKYDTLDDAIRLAEFAHQKQTDKVGQPYIDHPMRVLKSLLDQGAPEHVLIAAILHDVTEDTAFTCEMLLDLGVPEESVNIIRLLDRDHSKTIHTEIGEGNFLGDLGPSPAHKIATTDSSTFYYKEIRKNPMALQVKLADIADNMLEWRLRLLDEKTQVRLRKKYQKALDILNG